MYRRYNVTVAYVTIRNITKIKPFKTPYVNSIVAVYALIYVHGGTEFIDTALQGELQCYCNGILMAKYIANSKPPIINKG